MKRYCLIFALFFYLIFVVFLPAYSTKDRLTINWRPDLEQAKKVILTNEITLKNSQDRSQKFSENMDAIINNLDKFKNDDEVKVEFSKALASIKQLHTKLELGNENILPFLLYMSENKLYVIDTLPQYSDYIFSEIVDINNHPVDLISEDLKQIVSVDNEAGYRVVIPSNIIRYSMLHGLGIINSEDTEIPITFKVGGKKKTINTSFVYQGDSSLQLIRPNAEKYLYLKYGKGNYEYVYLPNDYVVYVAYNSCEEDPEYSMEEFSHRVARTIQENTVSKVIIDLRNNRGGNSEVISPLLTSLSYIPEIKNRIIVLIGRHTASSAMINAIQFRSDFNATLVGEPANGDPNKPGDLFSYKLQESGTTVSYSTKTFRMQDSNETSLVPNIIIETSIQDLKEGKDPVLDEALNYTF